MPVKKTTVGNLRKVIKEAFGDMALVQALSQAQAAVKRRFKGRVTLPVEMIRRALIDDFSTSGQYPTLQQFSQMMAATEDSEDYEHPTELVTQFPECVSLFEAAWQFRGPVRESNNSRISPMINWQPFVTSAANMLKDEPGATPSDVASDVFRPSPDEEVREMLTAMRNSDPDLDGIIAATAAQEGVDPDALADFFYSGLDATEEYMDEDDEDEPLSYLDDDSAEDEDDDK